MTAKADAPTKIKYNTCSDYNIPIHPDGDNNNNSASSVLDKDVVASRGIGTSDTTKSREDVTEEIQSYVHAPLSWRREVRSLLSVLMFVTRLPVPQGIDIHPGFLMKGMGYFPVIGSMVGAVVAIVYDVGRVGLVLPSSIAACISTGVGWWLTGCFHEDGLTDSADGMYCVWKSFYFIPFDFSHNLDSLLWLSFIPVLIHCIHENRHWWWLDAETNPQNHDRQSSGNLWSCCSHSLHPDQSAALDTSRHFPLGFVLLLYHNCFYDYQFKQYSNTRGYLWWW